MCINIDTQNRLDFTVLQIFESRGNLINARYLRQAATDLGLSEELASMIVCRLKDRELIKAVVKAGNGETFAYRLSPAGYQALRKAAKRFGKR